MNSTESNPFYSHGVVTGEYFTDRKAEVARTCNMLTQRGGKLLLYGPRRMGKTSILLRAMAEVRQQGRQVIFADMSTASSMTDMGNRLLNAAGQVLGRSWKNFIEDLLGRLQTTVTVTPDPGTGLPIPRLDVQLRGNKSAIEPDSLGDILNTLHEMAKDRQVTLGVILDEFQEIQRFGGEEAEWRLRGVIQHHSHISYVFAGSAMHLIARMLDHNQAFYGLFDVLHVDTIAAPHLQKWIDERFEQNSMKTPGIGKQIVNGIGPRTHDIILMAHRCFELATKEKMPSSLYDQSLQQVLAEWADGFLRQWRQLTVQQQKILRAVTLAEGGLTSLQVMTDYSLESSSRTVQSAQALVRLGLLEKADCPTGYCFDSPFFREWVRAIALEDRGMG